MTDQWAELDGEDLQDMLLPDPVDLIDLADDLGWTPELEPTFEDVD